MLTTAKSSLLSLLKSSDMRDTGLSSAKYTLAGPYGVWQIASKTFKGYISITFSHARYLTEYSFYLKKSVIHSSIAQLQSSQKYWSSRLFQLLLWNHKLIVLILLSSVICWGYTWVILFRNQADQKWMPVSTVRLFKHNCSITSYWFYAKKNLPGKFWEKTYAFNSTTNSSERKTILIRLRWLIACMNKIKQWRLCLHLYTLLDLLFLLHHNLISYGISFI